jgi:hypothetical protein
LLAATRPSKTPNYRLTRCVQQLTWNVEATGSDVCAQQRAGVSAAKLEKGGRALGLLLLAVDVAHRDVHVVQQLCMVLY